MIPLRLAVLTALLVVLASGCLRQAAPSSGVSAVVRDFATGEPVAGAAVRVVEARDARMAATSDAGGHFTLARLGEKVTIEVAAPGKATLRRTLRLAPGEERGLDLFMVPEGASLPDDTILFERGDNIWRVDPAGLNPRNVTADLGGVHASPTWSGDRSQFAFIQRIPGRTQVVIRYPDGSQARFVGEVPDSCSQLRWSPDGRHFVFAHAARTPKGQYSELRSLDVYSGLHRDFLGGQEERDPAWSRDGRTLAWARFVTARTWDIWIAGADGGAARGVLTGHNAREPDWSPDGKRLVVASNREGDYNLYETAIEAPRPRKLTAVPSGGFARRGRYSPLGDEILFESNVHDGTLQPTVSLYALHLRTGRVREVMDDARQADW